VFYRAVVRGLLAVAIVASAVVAQAVITIDTVPVGNPGNAGEGSGQGYGYGGEGPGRICGAVAYTYKMGKHEVTNSQYCEFLNWKLPTISDPETSTVLTNDTYGLYSRSMEIDVSGGINYNPGGPAYGKFSVKSGYANLPVVYVSWYDGIRFANWLQNGQESGSTESGTYQISNGGKNSGTVHVPTAAERGSWTWSH
jgi:formylglycine-generating enzyme